MASLRLGIIGIGNMGSAHFACVCGGKIQNLVLTSVCDLRQERLDYCAQLAPDIACYTDWKELVNSPDVDAVLIAVPHPLHADIAITALRAGKHVLTEKPVDIRVSKAQALNECAKASGRVFGIMFNQRTDPLFQKAREIVQSGQLGEMKRTVWIITHWYRSQHYYDSGSWRATWNGEGGGVLLNQCPHQLDLWQWICGMPVKVESHLQYGKWHDIEVEDDVSTYVEYANGATGVFITSTGDAYGTNRLEIQLDRAKLVALDGDSLSVLEYDVAESEFTKTNTVPFGRMGSHEVDPQTDGLNPQHDGVLNAWGGAILRGTPMVADGREGLKGVILSNAMHLSSFLGKTVELPFDEDLYYEELMKRVKTSRLKAPTASVFADTKNTYGGAK